jgi:hypothetical protein
VNLNPSSWCGKTISDPETSVFTGVAIRVRGL